MTKEIQERVRLFRIVREIPYYVSVGEEQDFSCSTKAEILKMLLHCLDLNSRYRICEFRWEDLNLPKEILKLPHEDPEYHQYLEVYIPETKRWTIVDPTWDSGLSKIFEIAEWDGLSNTKIAVLPKKIYSPAKSMELIKKFNEPKEIEEYLRKNKKFLIAPNNYFKCLRSNFTQLCN